MTIEKPVLLTVLEAAEILRIKRAKVYILISIGSLKASKIGADWRVRTDSVEALIGELPADTFTKLAMAAAVKKRRNASRLELLNAA